MPSRAAMEVAAKPAYEKLTRVRRQDDGTITPDVAEMLAHNMADGMSVTEGWDNLGKRNTGWAKNDRDQIVSSPHFQSRLDILREARRLTLQDPLWGEAIWCVMQLHRYGMATRHMPTVTEATKMRVQIASSMQKQIQAAPPPIAPAIPVKEVETPAIPPESTETGPPQGKPGSPVPGSTSKASNARSKLMSFGLSALPEPQDDDG